MPPCHLQAFALPGHSQSCHPEDSSTKSSVQFHFLRHRDCEKSSVRYGPRPAFWQQWLRPAANIHAVTSAPGIKSGLINQLKNARAARVFRRFWGTRQRAPCQSPPSCASLAVSEPQAHLPCSNHPSDEDGASSSFCSSIGQSIRLLTGLLQVRVLPEAPFAAVAQLAEQRISSP